MNSLVEALDEVGGAMVRLSGETFASDGLRGMSDGDLLEVMSAAARVIRAGEAMVVEAATHVLDRSDVLGVRNPS